MIHHIGIELIPPDEMFPYYRRFRLRDFLKTKNHLTYKCYTNLVNFILNRKEIKKKDIILISRPILNKKILLSLKEKGVFIFYDRTDNWAELSNKNIEDYQTIELADIVTNSASYLYDQSKIMNSNSYFVPNGTELKEFKKIEKYKEKTAIYIGYQGNKFNWNLIEHVAENNKDWQFHLYITKSIPQLNNNNIIIKPFIKDQNELFEILLKSHIGLCTFQDTEWTKGMLPLKSLQYINAHLPILCSHAYEVTKNFPDISFEMNENTNLNDFLNLNLNFDKYIKDISWDNTFNKIFELLNDLNEKDSFK